VGHGDQGPPVHGHSRHARPLRPHQHLLRPHPAVPGEGLAGRLPRRFEHREARRHHGAPGPETPRGPRTRRLGRNGPPRRPPPSRPAWLDHQCLRTSRAPQLGPPSAAQGPLRGPRPSASSPRQRGADDLPKGPMGEAISYALGQWNALTLALTDPHLPIDNNASERALRVAARAGRTSCLSAPTTQARTWPASTHSLPPARRTTSTPSPTSPTSWCACRATRPRASMSRYRTGGGLRQHPRDESSADTAGALLPSP
jgi:hypothetical protein